MDDAMSTAVTEPESSAPLPHLWETDLFHANALEASLNVAFETQSWPESDSARRLAPKLYEEQGSVDWQP